MASRITPRTVAIVIVGVLVVAFVVLNRHRTRVSFIFFSAQAAVWVALLVAAAAGFLVGFLASRRRYRP